MKNSHAVIGGLTLYCIILLTADILLPPKKIEDRFRPSYTVQGETVHYHTCCTGGGTDSCTPASSPSTLVGPAVLIKRSRVFGRCTLEPLWRQPTPCQCP